MEHLKAWKSSLCTFSLKLYCFFNFAWKTLLWNYGSIFLLHLDDLRVMSFNWIYLQGSTRFAFGVLVLGPCIWCLWWNGGWAWWCWEICSLDIALKPWYYSLRISHHVLSMVVLGFFKQRHVVNKLNLLNSISNESCTVLLCWKHDIVCLSLFSH